MLTAASAHFMSVGRQLALPLPLFMVLAGPTARAQAVAEVAAAPGVAPLANVSVYPNPAHIRATVQVPPVSGTSRATVTLLDAQGTVVFEQPMSLLETGGTTEVPLLGRKPGLYRVQVQAGDQRVVRTLTVE